MDITGEHELDVSHTMYKTKLDVNGHIIPSTATRMPDKEREKGIFTIFHPIDGSIHFVLFNGYFQKPRNSLNKVMN